MFICGTMDGLIEASGRRHNTEDIIATVMAVEPHSFIYKGRYCTCTVCIYIHTYMYLCGNKALAFLLAYCWLQEGCGQLCGCIKVISKWIS